MEKEGWLAFANAFGSAIGGFLGTFLFFLVRYKIEKNRKREKVTTIYYPGESKPTGEGNLISNLGIREERAEQLRLIKSDKPVWSFSYRSLIETGKIEELSGRGIFWGPYNADLKNAGNYNIKFKIITKGIQRTSDWELLNAVFLRLDVLETINTGGTKNAQNIRDVKYVRYSDLLDSENGKEFILTVNSNGTGVWEYRALLPTLNGVNVKKLLDHSPYMNIYFTQIIISYSPEISFPW